jgi:PAS domain-containing protein
VTNLSQKVIPPASGPTYGASTGQASTGAGVVPSSSNVTNNGQHNPHLATSNTASNIVNSSMKPPAPPAAPLSSQLMATPSVGVFNQVNAVRQSVAVSAAPGAGGRILPNVEGALPSSTSSIASSSFSGGGYQGEGKKQMKRAANRRSAQLSRKRKKQFIEELKEENDELRRKEQILRAIPDLIVVFDSSGKLGFVSESASRFFDMSQEDLEGTSFWDRLCDDSVRLLKAAFMDSLAARTPDSDTAPLGSGVWELRLVDMNSNYKIVTMNGVVHFTGDSPECVCCIRPREETCLQTVSGTSGAVLKEAVSPSTKSSTKKAMSKAGSTRNVSSSDYSRDSDGSSGVNPCQSVMMRSGSSAEDEVSADPRNKLGRRVVGLPSNGDDRHRSGQVVRISDGDSVEAVSESGSDDGIASS